MEVVKLLHILLEVYLLIETRQRSSAWALLVENTNRTKSVIVLSNLKHSEQEKLMDNKIMSVAFKTFVRSDGST